MTPSMTAWPPTSVSSPLSSTGNIWVWTKSLKNARRDTIPLNGFSSIIRQRVEMPRLLTLARGVRIGNLGAQAGVSLLYFHHFAAIEGDEHDFARRGAVDPIFEFQPVL